MQLFLRNPGPFIVIWVQILAHMTVSPGQLTVEWCLHPRDDDSPQQKL